MSAPTLAQFSQLQSDLITALGRISVLEDKLKKAERLLDACQDSIQIEVEDRLRALETDAEDDASSVYVSDEDSGGSTY
jgi:hypothetical protein